MSGESIFTTLAIVLYIEAILFFWMEYAFDSFDTALAWCEYYLQCFLACASWTATMGQRRYFVEWYRDGKLLRYFEIG